MAGIYPPAPITQQEIEAARRRMLDARYQADRQPSNIGQGLSALGDALSYRRDMQALQGQGMAPQQQRSPAARIMEALSGNKMPWQFPEAPSVPGQQQPAQQSFQPRQSVVQSHRAAPAVTAPAPKIDPNAKPAPFFFEHFFKPKGGGTGGLW